MLTRVATLDQSGRPSRLGKPFEHKSAPVVSTITVVWFLLANSHCTIGKCMKPTGTVSVMVLQLCVIAIDS